MSQQEPQDEPGREPDTEATDEASTPAGGAGAPGNGLSGLPPDAPIQVANPDPEQGGEH